VPETAAIVPAARARGPAGFDSLRPFGDQDRFPAAAELDLQRCRLGARAYRETLWRNVMKPIDARQLKKMLKDDPHPTVINTLPEEHFSATRIPDSINIPQDDENFVRRVEEAVGDHEEPVVVYCASPECDSSTKAAHKLEDAGFSQVYEFEAGAKGWQEAGEKLQAATT
jgi:rhodanese-related sulfurtransferase